MSNGKKKVNSQANNSEIKKNSNLKKDDISANVTTVVLDKEEPIDDAALKENSNSNAQKREIKNTSEASNASKSTSKNSKAKNKNQKNNIEAKNESKVNSEDKDKAESNSKVKDKTQIDNEADSETKNKNKTDSKSENNVKLEAETKEANVKKEDNTDNSTYETEVKDTSKTSHKTLITICLFISILLDLLAVFSTAFALVTKSKDTIIDGVSIKNIDVSGLTKEQAAQKLSSIFGKKILQEITLYHNDYELVVFPEQFGVSFSIDQAVDMAYSKGRSRKYF